MNVFNVSNRVALGGVALSFPVVGLLLGTELLAGATQVVVIAVLVTMFALMLWRAFDTRQASVLDGDDDEATS